MKFRNKQSYKKEDVVYKTHPAFKEDRKRDALDRMERPFRRRSVLIQLALFVVVLILWPIPIINPIKLLVVLFHELSHVFAAYATGGVVFGIAIDPGGAGATLGMRGNEILIVAAGYVGSLFIGYVLYGLSAVWKPIEVWAVLFLLCCISPLFGWLNDFTAFFAYGTIILMFFCFLLSEGIKKFLLRLIATTCCLYPVIDVMGEYLQEKADGFMIKGESVGSDVSQLAALTGIPEIYIAIFWITTGLTMVYVLIRWASHKEASTEVKKSLIQYCRRKKLRRLFYDPEDPDSVPTYTLKV